MQNRRGWWNLILESGTLALQSVWAHKLRTFLTLLGIIIGVASVLLVGASIQGFENYLVENVSRTLGSNSFTVSKLPRFGQLTDEEREKLLRRNRDLTLEDLQFLRRHCSLCRDLTAEITTVQTVYREGREQLGTVIRGVSPEAVYLKRIDLAEGRFFTEQENHHSRLVCVIGWELRESLFQDLDPIGRTIKIQGRPFVVIGVLEKMGTAFGQSLDNLAYIPISSYQKLFGSRQSISISGRAPDRQRFEDTLEQVRLVMRVRHKLPPNQEDDFGLMSTEEINSQVDQFTAAVAQVVIPVTLISLLVGGIVIMNMMLVSVTERTFEIGLRKALGATRKDVLFQFLIESSLVAALGGVIGILLAALISQLVRATTPIPTEVSLGYVLLAVGVSGGVGIVFGIYPAYRAARLDPIVALTSER